MSADRIRIFLGIKSPGRHRMPHIRPWIIAFCLILTIFGCKTSESEPQPTAIHSSKTVPHEALNPGIYTLAYLLSLDSVPFDPEISGELDPADVRVEIDKLALKRMEKYPGHYFDVLSEVTYARNIAIISKSANNNYTIRAMTD